MHVPPLRPVKPGLHWHAVLPVLPSDEFEFAGQTAHGVEPVAFLYVPGIHIMQIPASRCVEPALQVQLVCPLLPAAAIEYSGHWSAIVKSTCTSSTKVNTKVAKMFFCMLLLNILALVWRVDGMQWHVILYTIGCHLKEQCNKSCMPNMRLNTKKMHNAYILKLVI